MHTRAYGVLQSAGILFFMAVPPVIPTSFVPRPAASAGPRGSLGLGSVLAALGYFFLLLALVAAAGVFLYGRLLASEQATSAANLAKAESSIDEPTIESLVQLRNRLTTAETLLNSHLAFSGLFDLLETVTPADASFSSIHISFDQNGNAVLVANGTARSFNSLAAASNDFSMDARLKNTIFSNLQIGTSGSVGFVLTAVLDPKLIAYTGASAPAAGATTNTAATGTSTATTTTP